MQNVFPALRYRDARAAIDWLGQAFGYVEHMVVDGENGKVTHAQLTLGEGRMVMLSSESDDRYGSHVGSEWSYVVIDDPDGLFERAHAAGAEIVQEPIGTEYGSRDFSVRDPEGNLWSFGTYHPLQEQGGGS